MSKNNHIAEQANDFTLVDPEALSRVGVKLFFANTDQWELSDDERLRLADINSRSTLLNWWQKNALLSAISKTLFIDI